MRWVVMREKGEKEKARKHEGRRGEKDTASRHSALDAESHGIAGLLNSIQYRNDIQSVEIFDVYGRSVLSHTSHLTPQTSHLINISHINSGIYFVKITTDIGVVVKKVVKQ